MAKLLHENFLWSLFPPHGGIRQYWRDVESLERWARSEPHRAWWKNFLRDSGGTGFWHETYFMRGGIEAIYDDLADGLAQLCADCCRARAHVLVAPESASGRRILRGIAGGRIRAIRSVRRCEKSFARKRRSLSRWFT
jgi:hypothetical protein